MGTHGANDMPHDAEEWILPQWLEEHQMRIYEAFQRPELGGAEGIMCAISAFATAGDVPPPRNNLTSGVRPYIPNCANPYLLTHKLREQWASDCFVQSDCCDSIDAVVAHDWVATLPEAVAAVVNAGLSASYGNAAGITAALQAALASGAIPAATYAARIQRTLLTLFRVGVFDTGNPANPFRGPYNESALDGSEHRALAREAAARAVVLLENRGGALPLRALPPRVAVIGPFAHCTDRTGDYGCHEKEWPAATCSYGHSYSGTTSAVATVLSAAQAEAARSGAGVQVQYALGSGFNAAAGADGLAQAVNASAWADLVVLVLGVGCAEGEGRDRYNLTLSAPQQALLDAVSGAVRPGGALVVALAAAGGVDVLAPRADALLQVFYNGEETGSGLWDVLLGRVSPSARMPLTAHAWQYLGLVGPEVNFNMVTNGVGRTYRYFNDSAAAAASGGAVDTYVRYRFGYGQGYCTFQYSSLSLAPAANGSVAVSVSVRVASVSAALAPGAPCTEATQVYLTLPPAPGLVTPIYSLVAFASTPLPPDAAAPPTALSFTVVRDDLLTTRADGTRDFAGGAYTFAVSGHLPDDAKGLAQSNAVVGVLDM